MVLTLGLLALLLPFHQRLKAKVPDGAAGLIYLGLYGVGRFWLSYFRTDPAIVYGLRQAQLASLLMTVVAVIAIPILIRRSRAPKPAATAEPTESTQPEAAAVSTGPAVVSQPADGESGRRRRRRRRRRKAAESMKAVEPTEPTEPAEAFEPEEVEAT
jgi:phosphatidylglycerol:prolipoprotein diacylglycerol transferase